MARISYEEHYADMDIDELEFGLEDISNAIGDEYEKFREAAAYGPECAMIHAERISNLKKERAYIRQRIEELMNE